MLTHKGTVTLTTPRLTLRRLTVDDAAEMYENLGSDENVPKYLSWNVHESPQTTRELLEAWIPEYEKLNYYNWAIVFNGAVIGTINFHAVSDKHEHLELGYSMGSKWWNTGIMTEAVGELIHFAFEELNANKVNALHDTENPASGRVMEKNGMKREGILREHTVRKDGTRGDLVWYAVLKKDWRGNRV